MKLSIAGRLGAFFIVSVLCLVGISANAATYYVSTSGSDSNNGTSTATPWADLSVSVGKLSAGDVLLLKRGDTFNETSTVNVADANVTVGAYGTGARPIIDGQTNYPVDNGHYAPMVKISANDVTVKDIEIRRTNGHGLYIAAARATVNGVRTFETYMAGIIAAGVDSPTVVNSEVEKAAMGWGVYRDASYDNDPTKNYPYSVMPSALSFKTVTNGIASNNKVGPGWGEGINAWYGSQNTLFEDNTVFCQRNIGIYNEFSQNTVIRRNRVIGCSLSDYYRSNGYVGDGIVINNERDASPGTGAAASKNIDIYDNVVVNTLAGVAFWNQFEPTNHQDIRVVNNTFIDNDVNIKMNNTTYTNVLIANNLFSAFDAGTTQTSSSTSIAGITFKNNAWQNGSRTGMFIGANDITSGIVLPKTTGWRTFTVATDFDITDAKPSAGSTSIGAGSASLNGLVISGDINGTALNSPPDIGAVSNVTAAPVGDSTITAVTPNELLPSTSGYVAVGTGLSGVISATVSDGVDTESLDEIVTSPDDQSFVFATGALTNIDTSNATLEATYATPDFISHDPRTWTASAASKTDYTGTTGVFSSSVRVASNGATWNRILTDAVTATASGQVVNMEFYYSPGTSNKVTVYGRNLSTGNTVSYGGTITGSISQLTNSGGTSISFNQTNMGGGIYRAQLQYTTNAAGIQSLEIGAYTATAGLDVIVHGGRAWIDRSPQTVTYEFTPPFTATLSDLNTDNIVDPISAANGSNLFALSGDIGGVNIPFITPNVSGSVATFKSPDLSGLATGNQTLTLNVAQPAEIDQTPTGWPTNSGTVAVTSYTGTHLGYGGGAKLTVDTGGADWGGFKVDDLVTVAAGDVIEQWVDVVQSTGGQVRVSLTNQTAGGYVDYKGILGALSSTAQTACSSSNLSETAQDGMTRIKILCTSAAAGAYRLSITTNSSVTGDAVIVLGRTTYVNASPIAKTLTVNNPGGIVPEPEPVKKIKFTSLTGLLKRAGVAYTGTATKFAIWNSNPLTVLDQTPLAVATSVQFSSGNFTDGSLIESELSDGSINALLSNVYYWISIADSDGDPYWVVKKQITLE